MARAQDLIGLGMSPFLARQLGNGPHSVAVAGTSAGSATQIGGDQHLVYVISSNSGSGLALPPVGGDTGTLLGNPLTIANLLGATIQIYAANNAQGSVVTLWPNGASVVGTTGFSVSAGKSITLLPISASTWIGLSSASV